MLGGNSIGTGFNHSCVVSNKGSLYVWGANNYQQLTSEYKHSKEIDRPSKITLKYKNIKFKAKSVFCGPSFTFVIASNKLKNQIMLDQEELEILNPLKDILYKQGSLARFFGLIGKKDANKKGPIHDFLEESEDEYLKTEEAESLPVPRGVFIEKLEEAGFTQKKAKIHSLAERLIDENKGHGENILLGDIEDFALGYRQNQTKVFAFGQGHKKIFSFQKKPQVLDNDEQSDQDENEYEARQRQLQKQYESEIIVIARPTVIKFPKHTRPITIVACGSAHILAVTDDFKMFSWGCGSYGALGFGHRNDVNEPTQVEIKKKEQGPYIIGIACGKQHSMCISKKRKIFTWGTGLGGRLGHGNEEDQLVPKEINDLSKQKPIFISAGESHSAAISDKLKLFTWGNGSFGRLGHGLDSNEKKPKLVEDLDQHEITYVTCGSFHTIALTSDGQTYVFGQGKYGKLGINKKDRESIFNAPQKISFFKVGNTSETSEMLQLDKSEMIQSAAGYNHSIAMSRKGKIYTWGYNGKGLLGRQKGFHEYLPLEVGLDKLQGKIPNAEDMIKKGNNKEEENFSYEIIQVACASMNTMALTNGGEIYIFGSNSYGQLGFNKDAKIDKRRRLEQGKIENSEFGVETHIALLRFPGEHQIRINYIACGGEHMFAVSRMTELFGWGRNEEGQLGLGLISEYVYEPTLIREIAHKNIQQIACGDNYTAALSAFGEVFVTGSLEGGKLGLGQAMRSGYLLSFQQIQDLPPIKFVACGPYHMLAISEYNSENSEVVDGMTYSWGRNTKSQLGIGGRDDQNIPRKIMNAKERFKKVACGHNYSLGLSHSGQLYFWGNYNYSCDYSAKKNIEEPVAIKHFEPFTIKDISCCYKYSIALTDKGEMQVWGSYLKAKKMQEPNEPNANSGNKQPKIPIVFPQGKKDMFLDQICTGPSHSSAISVKRALYTWGHNESEKLGLDKKELKRSKIEPVLVSYINNLMSKNKQNLKEGIREDGAEEDIQDPQNQQHDQDANNMPEISKFQPQNEDFKYDKSVINPDQSEEEIMKELEEEKLAEEEIENKSPFEVMQEKQIELMEDIMDEKMQVFEDKQPQEKLQLISLQRQQTMIDATIVLQKLLKKERYDQFDEEYILRFDEQVQRDIQQLLDQFKDYQQLEKQRKDILIQVQSSMLQRIAETPFNVQIMQTTRAKGLEPELIKSKKQFKQLITALHVHPCYLVRIYKNKLLSNQEFVKIVKEVYSYQNERVNYLVMALIQSIVDTEIQNYQSVEEVDFLSKDSVIGSLIKYILKSQETNIDTLSSIACHVINKLLNKFSSSSINQDNTFDVLDKLKQGNKQVEDKQAKNSELSKRAQALGLFVEELIKDIVENEVLYPYSAYFEPKKHLVDELNKRKGNNNNQGDQPKLQALRFSFEISYLAEMLSDKLKHLPCKGAIDDIVTSKILAVIFGMLDKIWKDMDIFLYPYIKEIKRISILEDVIKKIQFNNFTNVFHMLSCFFKNETCFQQNEKESWNKELAAKLNHLQQSSKGVILTRIIDNNSMKSISFKNFENLILHSLDSEGHTVTIRKRTIGKLCELFQKHPDKLSLVKPHAQDPFYQVLLSFPQQDFSYLSKANKMDKINIKLKTRLLIDEDNAIASRCGHCNAILVQSYALPDSLSVLEKYNPEDSQSLMVQYCNILKKFNDLTKSDDVIDYIDKTYNAAKKNSNFDLANQLNKFIHQVDTELSNAMNKNMQDQQQRPGGNDGEKFIKETIFKDIQNQAESKINQRRTRKYDLNIIQRRIQQVLRRKIMTKVNYIKEKELMLYKMTNYNVQYGLANHELKLLADAYTELKHMRRIIDYTTSTKMSINLFKNLRNEQKMGLKSVVKKKASDLMNNKTITNIPLTHLEPLMRKCEFTFFEDDSKSIIVKLVFREEKWALCGPPKITSEAQLLTFQVSQKELLEMRKTGKGADTQRIVFANAIEFDHSKLLRIFNEMDRSRSAYVLNSGATPQSLHKAQISQNKI